MTTRRQQVMYSLSPNNEELQKHLNLNWIKHYCRSGSSRIHVDNDNNTLSVECGTNCAEFAFLDLSIDDTDYDVFDVLKCKFKILQNQSKLISFGITNDCHKSLSSFNNPFSKTPDDATRGMKRFDVNSIHQCSATFSIDFKKNGKICCIYGRHWSNRKGFFKDIESCNFDTKLAKDTKYTIIARLMPGDSVQLTSCYVTRKATQSEAMLGKEKFSVTWAIFVFQSIVNLLYT